MIALQTFLPGTGRWRAEGVTEGEIRKERRCALKAPSTASRSPSPFRGGIVEAQKLLGISLDGSVG